MEPTTPSASPQDPTPNPSTDPMPDLAPDPAPEQTPEQAPTPTAEPSPPLVVEEPPAPVISQTFTPTESKEPLPPPFTGSNDAASSVPDAMTPAPTPPAAPVPGSQPATPAPAPGPIPGPQPIVGAPEAAPGSQPTVMVGDGGIAVPPSGKTFTPTDPAAASSSRLRLPKKALIPVVVVLLLIGSASAFYFGYYNSPSVIYAQSLKDTGTGYDRLVTYADQQSKEGIAGYAGSGSYALSSSSDSIDGNMAFKNSQGNSDTTFDVGSKGIRVSADVRTIKSSTTYPDIYVKVSGIKGLGTAAGDPSLDPALAKLDSKWIFIDHTTLESASGQSGQTDNTSPTREELLDEARAFGQVNQQYLFSTSKDKAVTKVIKNIGKETVDGRSTYHYQVALQKDNVRKYILAQRDALKNSKLDVWLKQSHEEASVLKSFDDAANSAKNIKSGDTYDVWVDTGERTIYKVRYSFHPNPANNYVDVGLNYKGGNDYPFFVSGKSEDSSSGTTTYSFVTDINTSTNTVNFQWNEQAGGSDAFKLNANFALKPSKTTIDIARPTSGVISLAQAADDLGYGSLVGGSGSSSTATTLSDKLFKPGTSLSVNSVRDSLLRQVLNR